MENFKIDESQLELILNKIFKSPRKTIWDSMSKIIPILAVIIGGVWALFMYINHDKEKNEVLLEISKNQNRLAEFQLDQTELDNLNLKLRTEILANEKLLKEFEVQNLNLKRAITSNEIQLQKLIQANTISKTNLNTTQRQINELTINEQLAKSIDWNFELASQKSRELLYKEVTDKELQAYYKEYEEYYKDFGSFEKAKNDILSSYVKKEKLSEYLTVLKIDITNNGNQPISINSNDLVFYKGKKIENDSSANKIYKINSPLEEFSENAIKWEKLSELHYDSIHSINGGIIGKLGKKEVRTILYQFYINLEPEYILGIGVSIKTQLANQIYESKGFKILDYNSDYELLKHIQVAKTNIPFLNDLEAG